MKHHDVLEKFIAGLAKGYANSLIVVSKAGYGKTETTINTLHGFGYKEGEHYTYLSNYITPVSLYNRLQDVNQLQDPKILILDDVEETLKNPQVVGLLKGALWGVNGKRKVCWVSNTTKIDKTEFDFHGKIIFLLNDFNKKSPVVFALRDRGFFYQMEMTNEELIKMMEERAKEPYKNIPIEKRKEIVQFLIKVGGKSSNITLRLLPKAYNLYLVSPNHYKELILKII